MKTGFLGPWAVAAALGAAMGTATDADAAVVTLASTCTANCSELGLAEGAAVSAQFEVHVSALGNQTLGRADVEGFSVSLGNIAFDDGDLSNWDFFLTTDAAGTVSNFQFLASFGSSINDLADSIDLRLPWWAAAHHGTCRSGIDGQASPCDFASSGNNFGYAGLMASGNLPELAITLQVPEPPPLALAGIALGALTVASRRRRPPPLA